MTPLALAPPLHLRPEAVADDTFLFELFCEARPELMLLPGPMRATMLAQQYRAQAASYGARYPAASRAIVVLEDAPAGRLIVDESGDELHLVDIAVSSNLRGKGIGGAILTALTALARETNRPVRLYVGTGNPGALQLYLRHGFRETARDVANIEMQWP